MCRLELTQHFSAKSLATGRQIKFQIIGECLDLSETSWQRRLHRKTTKSVVVFQGSWPGQTSMIFNCHTPALKHSFTPNVSTQLLGASTVEVKCKIVEQVFCKICELSRLLLFHSTEEASNNGDRAHYVMASKILFKSLFPHRLFGNR